MKAAVLSWRAQSACDEASEPVDVKSSCAVKGQLCSSLVAIAQPLKALKKILAPTGDTAAAELCAPMSKYVDSLQVLGIPITDCRITKVGRWIFSSIFV